MEEKELLNNFKEIREGLERLNEMVSLIVRMFYSTEDEVPEVDYPGVFEMNIEDVQPRSKENLPSYVG